MGSQANFYVTPPKAGWRARLQHRHDFLGRSLMSGRFVEYVGRINDAIFYHYPGCTQLNSRYADEVRRVFVDHEIGQLISALDVLAGAAGKRRVVLGEESVQLLVRAQKEFGHLMLRSTDGEWPLDSLALPKPG